MSFASANQGSDFMVDPRNIPGVIDDPTDDVQTKRHVLTVGARRLWVAVVQEAFRDIVNMKQIAIRDRATAKAWLEGAESRFPFSRACLALGLSFDAWQRRATRLWQETEDRLRQEEKKAKRLQRVSYNTKVTVNKHK